SRVRGASFWPESDRRWLYARKRGRPSTCAITAQWATARRSIARPSRRRSTLLLKSGIDFHLADDAELVISTNQAHYPAGDENGVLTANGARDLKITGTGNIAGRATEFMTGFNKEGEIWEFGAFRPKMFILTGCQGLEVRDISFSRAPQWGLHMLGCEHVLVDGVKIRNNLDVPN